MDDRNDREPASVDQLTTPPISLRWAVLIAVLLLLASAVTALFDESLSRGLVQRKWPSDLKRAIDLSEVMAHGLSVAVILLLIRRVSTQVRPRFWWLVACPVAGGLGANLAKAMVSRLRPYKFWELQAVADSEIAMATFAGWLPILEASYLRESWRQSFPSGHTATAFAFAVGLSWVFPQGRGLFFLLAGLAGLQRIVSHSHWPSDVLAGAAVGLVCGALVITAWQRQACPSGRVAENDRC
jgi:membrane-associated phospholipid phosphatase